MNPYAENNRIIEEALGLTTAQRRSDIALWQEYTSSKLQPLALLEKQISELNLPIDPILEERGRVLKRNIIQTALDLKPLHFDMLHGKHPYSRWFTDNKTRFIYEMLISLYLPQVERKDIIDFKVAVGTKALSCKLITEECPEEFENYIGAWINHLNTNDEEMKNIETSSSGKIVRRGLCFTFTTMFISRSRGVEELEGHQIFVMIEKWPEKPNQVNLYIVDNLPERSYKYNIWKMTGECIQKKIREIISPDIKVSMIAQIPNLLHASNEMGSCVSVSFRAMIYSSFLYNPFKKIMNIDNRDQENERVFKLMYLQMERMRYSILMNPLLWDPSKQYNLYYIHKEPVSDKIFDIHNINTPYLWIIPLELIEEFIRRRESHVLMHALRVEPEKLKKWVFNLSFDIDISTDTGTSVRGGITQNQSCRISAEFPSFNQFL